MSERKSVRARLGARLWAKRAVAAAGAAAVAVTASVGGASAADGAPQEEARATAEFLDADLLGLSLAELVGARSASIGSPEADTASIDVGLLERLVGVGLGTLGIPVIGDGTNAGLLDLGPAAGAGLLNGYAHAPDGDNATAASGAVTDDGAINLGAVRDHPGTDLARLDATALLDRLGVAGLTDQVVDEVSLGLGALASSATQTTATGTSSDYVVAGADLKVSSPLVGTLADTLGATTDEVESTVGGLLGPNGAVQQTLGTLDVVSVDVLGLVALDLGSPRLTATVDLSAVSDELLATPLVSENGLVSIDLASGDITVDLAMLHGGDLNGLAPNTELLTASEITRITDTIAELLGELVDRTTAAVDTALRNTTVDVSLTPTVRLLGGIGLVSSDVAVSLHGTLGDFLGQTGTEPEVDVSGSIRLLGLSIPTDDIVGAVTEPLLTELVPAIGGALSPVLSAGGTVVDDVLGGAVRSVLTTLDPVLEGVLSQILSLTVNSQPNPDPAPGETFSVTALRVTVLPAIDAVDVPLATSSVRVQPLAAPAPDDAAPVITGADDAEVPQGAAFDPLAGVTASDAEDGDLTGSIEVGGTVDTTTPGTYELTYTVTDTAGQTTTVTRTVTVTETTGSDPGDGGSDPGDGGSDPEPDDAAPVITGADDAEVPQGAAFDPLAGVTASDAEDGDLTGSI
ncbi:choice-of-anchor G family protein, partial [Puerhibacterium puerhi]|uniref:choice-of-anchor G family protein n=1 Tax=Puerhibacterium puerhi TaxID=2692623 RepID=UPI0019156F7F